MPLKKGDETTIGQVPDNAVFSFVESATPGLTYQKIGKEYWPIGHTRLPERDVRSGRPISIVQIGIFVKIEELLTGPLPYEPRAEKKNDFSFFSE